MEENDVLIGLSAIGRRFKVSRTRVRVWLKEGAPIVKVGARAYRATFRDVWAWLKQTYGPQAEGEHGRGSSGNDAEG